MDPPGAVVLGAAVPPSEGDVVIDDPGQGQVELALVAGVFRVREALGGDGVAVARPDVTGGHFDEGDDLVADVGHVPSPGG